MRQDAFYADSTFFDMFNYHFIYGNPATALKDPYSVVLMRTGCRQNFLERKIRSGKTITIENGYGKGQF